MSCVLLRVNLRFWVVPMTAITVTRATEAAGLAVAQACGYVTLRSVRSRVSLDWRDRCKRERRPFVELYVSRNRAHLNVEMEPAGREFVDGATLPLEILFRSQGRSYGTIGPAFINIREMTQAKGVAFVPHLFRVEMSLACLVAAILRDPTATQPDPWSVQCEVNRLIAEARR